MKNSIHKSSNTDESRNQSYDEARAEVVHMQCECDSESDDISKRRHVEDASVSKQLGCESKKRKYKETCANGTLSRKVSKKRCKDTKVDIVNKKKGRAARDGYTQQVNCNRIRTRALPSSFYVVTHKLNDAQKQAVIEMGFEEMIHFEIKEIPKLMGCWVVEHFDHNACTLNVGNGALPITITRETVHEVLGIPKGNTRINALKKSKCDPMTMEFRSQFPACKKRIYINDIIDQIMLHKDGGRMFKLNFLVLFVTIMAEGIKCGTVNQKFLPCVTNLNDVKNMDWCSYIVDCLKRTKKEWKRNTHYNGPIIFLVVLYASSTKLSQGKRIPCIKEWTAEKLRARETQELDAGGFGKLSLQGETESEMEDEDMASVKLMQKRRMMRNKKVARGIKDKGDVYVEETMIQRERDDVAAGYRVCEDDSQNMSIVPNIKNNSTAISEDEGEEKEDLNRGEEYHLEDRVYDGSNPYAPQNMVADCTLQVEPFHGHCKESDSGTVPYGHPSSKEMGHALPRKDSSLQGEIICIQGYKVKQSVAPILEAIFKKHGDIAAKCVFKTSSVISHFLEVVCEVVRQIQTNDVIENTEEIKSKVSDAEAAKIDVSWLQAHLEAIHKSKENMKKSNLLKKMKANTILVKKAAQLDLSESCAELVAAQERYEKAERCVRVLHLVEKNLNDNILESKAKIDSWAKQPIL